MSIKAKILLVDDSEISLNIYKHILSQLEAECIAYTSAIEALNMINDPNLALIISDIQMPDMDGIEFAQKVLDVYGDDKVIPIIFLSGLTFDDRKVLFKGYEAGAVDVLRKPANSKVLLSKVSFYLKSYEKSQEILNLNKKLTENQFQLIQSEKMASLGHLVSGLAHEINNPLSFVNNNFSTLEQYFEKFLTLYKFSVDQISLRSDCADLIEKIKAEEKRQKIAFVLSDRQDLFDETKDGLGRIQKIIASLQEFCNMDIKNLESYNVNSGLKVTIDVLSDLHKKKCEFDLHLNEVPSFKCMPGQLNQMFFNIILNSIESFDHNGCIHISTHVKGNYLNVMISDNGSGINSEDLPNIFNPFFTTKTDNDHLGLGLSIAHNIIKKHSGKIEVDSDCPRGTRAIVSLPLTI